MKRLVLRNVVNSVSTHSKVFSSSRRLNKTASDTWVTVEISKDPCGCKLIQGEYSNCNGEDIAQSIVFLADSLASLVGAKSAGEVLIDLSDREDFNIIQTSLQGVSYV